MSDIDGLGLGFIGASIGEGSAIQKGRNQGIIYCIEHKKSCTTEYDYLKLKENQKQK